MVEYIEREAALNRLCQENCDHDYVKDKCQNCYVSAFIEYAPAADVVPVVRCRDCVYNGLDSMPHTKDKCYRLMLTCFTVKPEDFCAWGRKKDGE